MDIETVLYRIFPALLEREFKRRGPWSTGFRIHGREYGGDVIKSWENWYVRSLFENFPNAWRILDLGSCGSGQTFQLAQKPGVRVAAVEGCESNIAKARFVRELLV